MGTQILGIPSTPSPGSPSLRTPDPGTPKNSAPGPQPPITGTPKSVGHPQPQHPNSKNPKTSTGHPPRCPRDPNTPSQNPKIQKSQNPVPGTPSTLLWVPHGPPKPGALCPQGHQPVPKTLTPRPQGHQTVPKTCSILSPRPPACPQGHQDPVSSTPSLSRVGDTVGDTASPWHGGHEGQEGTAGTSLSPPRPSHPRCHPSVPLLVSPLLVPAPTPGVTGR